MAAIIRGCEMLDAILAAKFADFTALTMAFTLNLLLSSVGNFVNTFKGYVVNCIMRTADKYLNRDWCVLMEKCEGDEGGKRFLKRAKGLSSLITNYLRAKETMFLGVARFVRLLMFLFVCFCVVMAIFECKSKCLTLLMFLPFPLFALIGISRLCFVKMRLWVLFLLVDKDVKRMHALADEDVERIRKNALDSYYELKRVFEK